MKGPKNGRISSDFGIYEMGSKTTDDGNCQLFRLTPANAQPIFPGSDVTLRRKLRTGVRIWDKSGKTPGSTRHVKASIFADEMPPIRTTLDIASVLLGWAPVQESES